MSDVVSFAEIAGQQAELLPARTLLQTSDLTDLLGTDASGADLGGGETNETNESGGLTDSLPLRDLGVDDLLS